MKCAISNGEHVERGGTFSLSLALWVRPSDGYYRYKICNECGPDNLAPYNIQQQLQLQQQQQQRQPQQQHNWFSSVDCRPPSFQKYIISKATQARCVNSHVWRARNLHARTPATTNPVDI